MASTRMRRVAQETPTVEISRREPVWLAWAVALAAIANVGVNTFSNFLFPITITEATRASRPLLIDPASYAFAIWAPIFVGLLAFAAYQLLPATRHDPRLVGTRVPMLVSFVCGALWPVAVSRLDFLGALVLIVGMLAGAAVAYPKLHTGHARTLPDSACVRWPVSAYVGWLSLATLISVTSVLANYAQLGPNWVLPDPVWAVLGILVAAGIGVFFGVTRRDMILNGAIAWGLIAIATRHHILAVDAAVLVALVLMGVGLVAGTRRRTEPSISFLP